MIGLQFGRRLPRYGLKINSFFNSLLGAHRWFVVRGFTTEVTHAYHLEA